MGGKHNLRTKSSPGLVFAQSTAFDFAVRSGRDEQTMTVIEVTGVDMSILVLCVCFCNDC